MNQIQQVEIRLIYSIQQETLSLENVDKIVWNEELTQQIMNLQQLEQKVEILGLYGTLETVKDYLNLRETCNLKVDKQIVKMLERGMLCWAQFTKTIYIAFIASDDYFTKDKFSESAEITIYRFLRDLCQNIILLPSNRILSGWKDNNHHYYKVQSSKIKQYEIKKVQETELTVTTLNSFVVEQDVYILLNNAFLPKLQQNIRCAQQQEKQKIIWENIFTNLLQRKKIEFSQYSQSIQKAFYPIIKEQQMKMEGKFKIISQELKKIGQKQSLCAILHLTSKNQIKDDETQFNQIHKIIINKMRQNTHCQNNQNKKVGQAYKITTSDIIFTDQNKILDDLETNDKANLLQLQELIKQYQEKFRSQLSNNETFFLSSFADIEQKIGQKQQQLLHYTLIHPILIKQNQIIEYRLEKKQQNSIYIKEFLSDDNIDSSNLKISYYSPKLSKQQASILIIANQKKPESYWIDQNTSNCKLITKITHEENKIQQNFTTFLLYHYDLSNKTLYIFNTRIGITKYEYDEERKQILSEKSIPTQLKFKHICYLQQFEHFILMDQANKLYNWDKENFNIQQIQLQINSFKPGQHQTIIYEKLMGAQNGNYYCLVNKYKCDIVNFNNEIIIQIRFSDYQFQLIAMYKILLFSNDSDWFICLLGDPKEKNRIIQIQNIHNQQKLISNQQNEELMKQSNPYFDLIKGSIVKFGVNINIQKTTRVFSQLYINKQQFKKLESYFYIGEFDQTDILNECEDIYLVQGSQIQISQLIFNLMSRIPIQLCTIDQSYLIPLSDGLQIKKENQSEESVIEKVSLIKFGILEKILSNYKDDKIFIVCIMGKQSSGKSYLLNRIFGTRFSVSSARCTDGIWMSVSQINNQLFIIFDCEGLFSTRRNSEEEIKLLAFMASLSDVTILNQDLTFSRGLNELFQNLLKTIDQIKGKQLFQGKLMIAVRDVNKKEQEGAQNELIKNIEIITKNDQNSFLQQLFNGQIQTLLMSYFEDILFENDVKIIRENFIAQALESQRWRSSQSILGIMKILLVQLHVTDNCSLEEHELRLKIQALTKKSIDMWQYLKQKSIEQIQFVDSQQTYIELINSSENGQILKIQSIKHNEIVIKLDKSIQETLDQRVSLILEQFDDELKRITNYDSDDGKKRYEVEQQEQIKNLIKLKQQYKICQEKCSSCFLKCILRKDHVQNNTKLQQNQLSQLIKQIKVNLSELDIKLDQNQQIEQQEDLIKLELEDLKVKSHQIEEQIKFCELSDQKKFLINQLKGVQKYYCDFSQFQMHFREMIQKTLIYETIQQSNDPKKEFEIQIEKLKKQQQIIKSKLNQLQIDKQFNQDKYNQVQVKNKQLNIQQLQIESIDIDKQYSLIMQGLQLLNIKKQQFEEEFQIYFKVEIPQVQISSIIDMEKMLQDLKLQISRSLQNLIEDEISKNNTIKQMKGLENYLRQLLMDYEDILLSKEEEQEITSLQIKNYQKQIKQRQFSADSKKINEIIDLENKQIQQENNIQIYKKLVQYINQVIQIHFKQNTTIQKDEAENIETNITILKQEEQKTLSNDIELQQINFIGEESQIFLNQNIPDDLSIISQNDQNEIEFQFINSQEVQSRQEHNSCQNEQLNNLNQEQFNHQEDQLELQKQILKEIYYLENPNFELYLNELYQKQEQIELAIKYQQFQSIKNQNEVSLEELKIQQLEYALRKQDIEHKIVQFQKQIESNCENIQILEKEIRIIQENLDNLVLSQDEIDNTLLYLYEQQQEYLTNLSIHHKIEQIDVEMQQFKGQQIMDDFDQLMKNFERINKLIGELDLQLQQIQSFQVYQQQLIEKTKELEEINNAIILLHKCGRESHKCDQICECCNNEQIYCKYFAGHEHIAHLCENNDHFCKQKCKIQDCEKQCQHFFQHEEIIQHDCKDQHPCKFKCQYNGCIRNCSISARDLHNDHKCDVESCTQECYFQQNSFSEDKKCHNKCSYSHTQNHDIHICSSQKHQCNHDCELPGVCKIETYSEIDKSIQSEDGLSTFNYKFIVQNDKKIQCQIMIDAFQIKHEGQHVCNQAKHTCDQRCPECNAFCNEAFDHKDGKHKPHLHRNKDIHKYTALVGEENEQSILQNEDQSIVMLKVGQSCEPETCSKNCFRRSRAHFHLLECDHKRQNCLKINEKYKKTVAQHQVKKYIGSDKVFDEVLCEYYWDYLGWEIPVDKTQRSKISQCNYYCNICESKEPIFCSQQAWHDSTDEYQSHNFACADIHKNIEGVDVQFVIDTTGSMQAYIDLVKKTIQRLIETSKKLIQNDSKSILFSIISYKDHLDQENKDSVCKYIDFNTHEKAITFLKNLVTEQGGDTPEAMLDGLHEASKQNWRQDSKKFLFLIADSPPHGLQYHNMDDDFPHGCPCGLKENEVLQKLKDKNIKVIFYMLNDSLNQTFQSFRRKLPNIEDVRKIEDEYFMKKIQKLVCQQLKIREVTIKKQ